jgi:L-rhamnose mutarotase
VRAAERAEHQEEEAAVQRFGSVIRLRPEKAEEYRELHRAVWPEVLAALKRAHVSNYSIFERDGYLFAYMEYDGDDFEADMRIVAQDEPTQRWWKLTDPCQEPLPTAAPGERWVPATELFHLD